jgi:hypothetical protein
MVRARLPLGGNILVTAILLLTPLCACGGGNGADPSGPAGSSEAGSSDAGSSDAATIIVVTRDAQSEGQTGEDAEAPSDAKAPPTDAGSPVEDAGDAGSDASVHDDASAIDSGSVMDALAPEAGPPICTSGTLTCNGACVPDDVHNCGTCGHDCTNLPHVSGPTGCSASGACVIASGSCTPGWADCDGNADDGCEQDITQPGHCGSCTTVCPASDPVCSGSGASYSCVSGCPASTPTRCSGSCVDTTSSASNCGACGNVCSEPTSGSGTGTAACVPAGCTVDCAAGLTACPAAPALATTCVEAQTDDDNCGGCGVACQGGEHCVTGACECTNGQHLCGSPAACVDETVSACGPSCQVCAPPAFATASCNGSSCAWTCNPGYTGCPTANPTACDVLGSDPNNCGSCGNVCTGGETCQSGACKCPAGETLCGTTCVNEATDSNNCGACPHSCLGGACSDGQCQPVEVTSGASGAIALDASNVYFVGGNAIYGCPKTGCSAPTSLLSAPANIFNLLYDTGTGFGARLYASVEGASVVDVLESGQSVDLASSSIPYPTGLANGVSTVYVGTQAGTIVAGEKGSGAFTTTTTLATDLAGPVAPVALDTSANVLYAGVEVNAGTIVRLPATGGSVETFATNQPNPFSIVVASGSVYWADLGSGASQFANGAVYMCPTGTSCPSPTLLGGGSNCASVSTDSDYVYFICSSSLYRCPLAGCGAGPTTLANVGAQQGAQVTNDATAIYFETASGALMKLAK